MRSGPDVSRRGLMAGAGGLFSAASAPALAAPKALPDRTSFPFEGVYLDAAFNHPFGRFSADAGAAYDQARLTAPQAIGPRSNGRQGAVERFARLINADPADIAVVPSTQEGENQVNAALAIGPGAGVITDSLHYDASLVLYGELARRGTSVGFARPENGRIDLADIARLITHETRLIAVSLVSSHNGFQYDLAELCALAHKRDVLVYADIIQAAGALPVDVKASGVDFACCGTYKWLMGDFGTAFLYVRPDRLERLKRIEVGWRQVRRQDENPATAPGDYVLATGAAGLFEISTPAWRALAIVSASLDYLQSLGVEAIARHRQPLVDHLMDALPAAGFPALTPKGSTSPVVVFAARDAKSRFAARLKGEGITISTYDDRLRISPSVYNTQGDIERLIGVLKSG